MIEHFTKEEFETAIAVKFQPLGLVQNEYCYLIVVTDNAGILIRSTVNSFGISADLGEDSIRVYPVEIRKIGNVYGYNLWGNSETKWVTRQQGWQAKLRTQIKVFTQFIQDAGSCEICGKPLKILKVKKEGKNYGRRFASCERSHDQFKWLEEL